MTLERNHFLYFCGKFLNMYVPPGTKGLKKEPQIFMFSLAYLTVLVIYLGFISDFCGYRKIKYMYIYFFQLFEMFLYDAIILHIYLHIYTHLSSRN